MSESISAGREPQLTTKTKTKIRTKVMVGTLVAVLGLGFFAGVAGIKGRNRAALVCDSGSRAGQTCRRKRDCQVTPTDRQARCVSAPAGRLTAEISPATPPSQIITGGSENVPVFQVNFSAVGEPFVVRKLRIKNDQAADGDGISIIRLRYPQADGTVAEAVGVFTGANADFTGLEFYVPQDSRAPLEVMISVSPITEAGISGDTPQLSLDFNDNFLAVGATSGRTLTFVGSADITGREMVLRKTKPTVTLHPASPSGGAVPGFHTEVLRFYVTADATGDVVLKNLTFQITSTDNAGSGWNTFEEQGREDVGFERHEFALYDAADLGRGIYGSNGMLLWSEDNEFLGDGIDGDSDGITDTDEVVRFVRLEDDYGDPILVIPAGITKTFVLKMSTSGASSSQDDVLRLALTAETELIPGNDFEWAEAGSGGVLDISGYLVRNLPVVGGTLTY